MESIKRRKTLIELLYSSKSEYLRNQHVRSRRLRSLLSHKNSARVSRRKQRKKKESWCHRILSFTLLVKKFEMLFSFYLDLFDRIMRWANGSLRRQRRWCDGDNIHNRRCTRKRRWYRFLPWRWELDRHHHPGKIILAKKKGKIFKRYINFKRNCMTAASKAKLDCSNEREFHEFNGVSPKVR